MTGAGSGIGAACAHALAQDGWIVTLAGRRWHALESVRETLPHAALHVCVAVDMVDESAVQAAFARAAEERGRIDALVNNAGLAESLPFGRTDDLHWRRLLDVNLMGAVHGTRVVLPAMSAAGFGRVVNIASTAALKGYAYVTAYVAAKHALLGFTRALALEVAARGVTVNAVCPGYTETPLLDAAVDNIVAKTGRSVEQARSELARGNPQGRLVRPEEVGDAVRWLCTDAAAAMTGQAIAVAGGEV